MNTEDLLELASEIGIDENSSIKDLLGLQTEIPNMIYQINVGKYRLAITFGGETEPEIKKHRGNIYTLNIQDYESHANFPWKGEWAKNLISKQLDLFMPIIKEFMVKALVGTL